MINATDLKAGITFEMDGRPYKVVKYIHQKIGRGGATVRVTLRNLINANLEERTMNSTSKLTEISTRKRSLQYLYKDGKAATFMDAKTYEQIEIPISLIEDELRYIKEGEDADVLFWDDPPSGEARKPLSIEISPKATLTVVETDPGVKGNSATNMYKPAILENGSSVKIPLFIKKGEKIVVDTRTGEYVERAK